METNQFIALGLVGIIAVVAIGIIFGITQTATTLSGVNNESIIGVADTYVSLANDNLVAVSAVRNATGTNKTVTTHYIVDLTNGRINITAAGGANGTNPFYVDYTYKADGYIDSSMTRSIISYAPVMLALLLFVSIAGYAYMKQK